MIVHLVGSLRNIDEDLSYLRAIIEIVHDQGAVLAHNWLEQDVLRHERKTVTDDWTPHVNTNLSAVKRADVIIIEATHQAFTQGFLLAAALEYKKPVLLISREKFVDKYISGIVSSLCTLQSYDTIDELKGMADSFLQKNTVHTKDLRFNMFLTREIARFLDNNSRETGRNQSEIIRNLIKNRIEE